MADTGSEMNGVMVGSQLDQESLINTNDSGDPNDESNGDDLLQLALEEASGGLANNTVAYTVSNDLVDAVTNEAFQGSIADDEPETLSFENATYVVSGDTDNFTTESSQAQFGAQTHENGNMTVSFSTAQPSENSNVIGTTSTGMTVTLVPANEGSNAPLGSSLNPIRIIQQGNQYTPVQQLTTDQLQQIMQVVQQQQVAKSASEGGGSSVLYNPQTNTKIVYRVIYPSELHKTASSSQNTQDQQSIVQLGQLPKRQYKKKLKEEEERVDGPELTREEKEARKKHRPRTRSGRVSKPPKHMMKDYKHIHVVDWDEDYDDSDGGYSDFKYSEDEKEEEKDFDTDFIFDTGQVRPKNWKCKTCHKSYIGRGGLGRHYRLNPTHGNADEFPLEESDSSNMGKTTTNGMNYAGSISEDSNTQDSLSGLPPSYTGPGRPRKKGQRGRPPLYEQNPAKKRHKLREFIKHYDTEDLMDIVLPRLAKVVTLWEFLMMKVESNTTNKPNIQNIYQEFETLTEKVKDLFKSCLKLSDSSSAGSSESKVKMSSSRVAEVLGFTVGTYEVDASVLQTSFQDSLTNEIDRQEILRHSEVIGQKRPNRVEVIMGPSAESPTKKFKSILPNDKKSNIVVSTQGNVVLMGTSQTTTASPQRVVVVSSAQTSSNPLIVLSKNSSAAVLDCVQSQPSNAVLGINQSQPSNQSVNQASTIVKKQTLTPSKVQVVPAVNSVGTTSSKTQSVVLNNKVTSLPHPYSSHTKSQSAVSSSKPTSILHNVKSTPVKSSGITILPVNNPTGFNTVGTISSVYNTSLLNSTPGHKQIELDTSSTVLSNNVTLLPSVVSTEGMVITANGINSLADIITTDSDQLQIVKSEMTDGNSIILSNFNNIDQNGTTTLVNSDISLENQSSDQVAMDESLMDTSHMESSEMVQFVDDQLVTGEQVNSTDNIITASNIYQTPDGIIIIQNPDGSTVQLQGSDGEPIPLETVQAILEGHYLQTAEDGVM